MCMGTNSVFPKVKDIGEWQRLCSSYSFHNQEDYKLEWWLGVIEKLCDKNKSLFIEMSSLKAVVQEEFKYWPIEVLCLPNIFKGLIKRKKLLNLNYINKYMIRIWESAIEVEKRQSSSKVSRIGFSWVLSLIGSFFSDKYILEIDENTLESDAFVCIPLLDKLSNKLVNDINRGLLGTISKAIGMDELLILNSKFKDYLIQNFELCETAKSVLDDIIIWYFITYSPGEWILKPFVVNKGNNIYVNAIKFSRSCSSLAKKEIEIYDTDVADIILKITEEDLQKSLTNLEEKFLFHDSKCKEYALCDQKQLAINHLKQRHQIEKALNDINEQLLVLGQSKVTLDTSNARISLLNALETSTNITKNIFNESEILKKLENINILREEVEVTQESINSMINSCFKEVSKNSESASDNLEKELDEILHRSSISIPTIESNGKFEETNSEFEKEKYQLTNTV
ncbi:Vps60p Vps20p like involved in vacuolar sorting [Cryptosporidium sp. chipmunk genotype I]|uniref:Vps60p Vps20p like involved in vacuolar sorting n=1 Tax=Cryptosporidium sp. chipmunk genotype I TaxID=1280935 RepID=UPI00351A1223|nr:Vps60p Vps20p like involved in vacuolar sorting [Cryptosporidium sp. chipmunk genotype I]